MINKITICSFCQRSEKEARILIRGPQVCICDECIFMGLETMFDPEVKKNGSAIVQTKAIDFIGEQFSNPISQVTLQDVLQKIQLLWNETVEVKKRTNLTSALSILTFDEVKILYSLSREYGIPVIDLSEFEIENDLVQLIPRETAEIHQLIAVNRAGNTLIVAMVDPKNIRGIDDVKFLTGFQINVVLSSERQIRAAIEKWYPKQEA